MRNITSLDVHNSVEIHFGVVNIYIVISSFVRLIDDSMVPMAVSLQEDIFILLFYFMRIASVLNERIVFLGKRLETRRFFCYYYYIHRSLRIFIDDDDDGVIDCNQIFIVIRLVDFVESFLNTVIMNEINQWMEGLIELFIFCL